MQLYCLLKTIVYLLFFVAWKDNFARRFVIGNQMSYTKVSTAPSPAPPSDILRYRAMEIEFGPARRQH